MGDLGAFSNQSLRFAELLPGSQGVCGGRGGGGLKEMKDRLNVPSSFSKILLSKNGGKEMGGTDWAWQKG